MIAGIVLAAGDSSRFGAVKQLVQFDGTSLLGRAVDAMAVVGEVDEVVVVLGANAQAIMKTTPLGRARVVVCRDWERGLAASLSAGLETVEKAEAAVITLADQPLVGAAAIRRLIAARDGANAVAALYGDHPGHPVLLERELFSRVAALEGDRGALELLEGVEAQLVPCADVASPHDVDRPEDLAWLQEERGNGTANLP